MFGFVKGLFYPLKGLGMLLISPSLLALSVLPVGLSGVLYAGGTWILWNRSGAWFDALVAHSGNRVVEALRWGAHAIFVALIVVGALLAFVRVTRILMAPFLDAISLRTEKILNPDFVDPGLGGSLLGEILREIRKSVVGLIVGVALLAVNLILPGLGVVLGLLLTWRALALDFLGFPLGRRGYGKPERKAFFRRHFSPIAGFAVGCFFFLTIPLLSLIAIPACVVAGTSLYSRLEERA